MVSQFILVPGIHNLKRCINYILVFYCRKYDNACRKFTTIGGLSLWTQLVTHRQKFLNVVKTVLDQMECPNLSYISLFVSICIHLKLSAFSDSSSLVYLISSLAWKQVDKNPEAHVPKQNGKPMIMGDIDSTFSEYLADLMDVSCELTTWRLSKWQ